MYYEDRLYRAMDLCQLISNMTSSEIEIEIKKFNGFFSFVKVSDNEIVLVVDHFTSMPLFYALEDGDVYVSDDAFWILKQLSVVTLDEDAVEEFLVTGHVAGNETLYREIKQVQAGEMLRIRTRVSEDGEINALRYFLYRRDKEKEFNTDRETLLTILDDVLQRVFERAIKVLNGRTAVIPLSGGYDSRLIAMMLRRSGYENVVCFSYGVPGNMDSEVSRIIAESLGYRWFFVEYNEESWKKWYESDAMRQYEKYSSGLASLPHFQDWPAVMELQNRKLIPPDSVFVPGHSAAFALYIPVQLAGEKNVLKAILLRFYILNPYSCEQRNVFEERIRSFLNMFGSSYDTFEKLASFYQCWLWQEREAKFIGNSVRVYEFWGYDWLMPLWDLELTTFLSRLPLEHYLNRRLYKEYVRRLCNVLGVPLKTSELPKSSLKTFLKTAEKFGNSFLPHFALQWIWKLKCKTVCKRRNEKSALAFFGMVDEKYRKEYCFDINSFLSKRFIERLKAKVYENVKLEMVERV
ncbi:MAG: hypothetical protein H5T94_05010 [Pseudothermotoga sp.]|nr:hypothetical protein [Pseudothermotoga sp.]